MKILFLFVAVIVSVNAHAADCKKKVDNSKVMIFVDTNESDLEIDTAEKAACDRGQKLVVVPQNYKVYGKTANEVKKAMSDYRKCSGGPIPVGYTPAKGKCDSLYQNYVKVVSDHSKFTLEQKHLEVQLKEQLDKIRKDKGTLESFTISGHDGGGMFGGAKSSMSKDSIGDIMKNYGDINQVKSALLLGCYTAVPKEIVKWNEIFPHLKMMAGYDGSAPLAVRPEGHQYLYDLLLQEKNLSSSADEKRLAAIIDKNFKSINLLHASMYLKPSCDINPQEKSFYYGNQGTSKGMREFDIKECINEKEKINNVTLTLDKYNSGEIETPADTSKGELRDLYNSTRRLEHCNEVLNSRLNSNAAFGLLFFNGYKNNFANFYSKDLAQAQNELDSLTPEAILKGHQDAVAIIDAEINDLKKMAEKMELFSNNNQLYIDYKENEIKESLETYKKTIASAEVKKLIEKYPELAENAPVGFGVVRPEDFEEYMKIYSLKADADLKKKNFDNVKENPLKHLSVDKSALEGKKSNAEFKKNLVVNRVLTVEDFKKIWIPTKENLNTKSRKEILENIHNISGLLANESMPPEIRKSLGWTVAVSSRHLYSLEAPFSWHEFTGQAEAPVHAVKLADYNYKPSGFGYGSSYGGVGFYGGMMPGMGMSMGGAGEYSNGETETTGARGGVEGLPNGGYGLPNN